MAPIKVIKTYSKVRVKQEKKEDSFDRLLHSKNTSNIFESSSDRENAKASSSVNKSNFDGEKSSESLAQESPSFPSIEAVLEISNLSTEVSPPEIKCNKRPQSQNTSNLNYLNKVQKRRTYCRKNKLRSHVKNVSGNDRDSLKTSTPISLKSGISLKIVGQSVSPIDLNTENKAGCSVSPSNSSPNRLLQRNILDGVLPNKCDIEASLVSHSEYFYGFPSFSEGLGDKDHLQKANERSQKLLEMFDTSSENKEKKEEIDNSSVLDCTAGIRSDRPNLIQFQLAARKSGGQSKVEGLSRSMQNINVSSNKNDKKVVKSSSFDESKTRQSIDKNSHPVGGDVTLDSSDIEESAVNSADERSCSIRSGPMDEEESAFHSSEDDNESGTSKCKDSVSGLTNNKTSSKGDSESAIFSGTQKDTSCTNRSGDASADDYDLYSESEIAKSSDSIEVSKTANVENFSPDTSTCSDKKGLKEEDLNSSALSACMPKAVKSDNVKQNNTGRKTVKAKESFYSLENSASDDSEMSLESDSELSCESSKSSRKSSLESAINLSKENLERLQECISSLKVQDEYENNICSKSRKSLSKRKSLSNTDWECPPSPRRSLYPLAPLFPLKENQEDPSEENGSGGHGSLCESTTASEDDSYHSESHKSRSQTKDLSKQEMEGKSSGEDESSKSSPVRETSHLRRSRRLTKKKGGNCQLNMVVEESDSESAEAELPQMEHIILPIGKKYRRSLSIIKHLAEEEENASISHVKGRKYDESVEKVIHMQSKLGIQSQMDGRRSLLIKRQSLLSQCYPSSRLPGSNISRVSVDLFTSILAENSPICRKSLRRFSVRGTLPLRSTLLMEAQEEEDVIEESGESFNQSSNTVIERADMSVLEESNDNLEQTALEESVFEDSKMSFQDDGDVSMASVSGEVDIMATMDYRDLVMKCCEQTEPCSFSDILPGTEWHVGCTKVGEGVYGEVFMIPRNECKNVMKIIPIEGNMKVNGENQKTYSEISNELLIAITLSDLREENHDCMTCGFAELVRSSIVKGRYPKKLIELWNGYDETKGSENDSPTVFGRDQLYLVLELGNAGEDLERYNFNTAKQGLSVFKQTVCALAVAEHAYQFEHRDLHWGNVLVARTKERSVPFNLDYKTYNIISNGVKATIIDFTLSRMSLKFGSTSHPVFCDIGQDPDMFIGAGDYQFDIYRAMKTDVQDRWSSFVPKTNVRWLHYLVDKMINRVHYSRKTAKVHNDSIKELKYIESWILSCENSVEVAMRIMEGN